MQLADSLAASLYKESLEKKIFDKILHNLYRNGSEACSNPNYTKFDNVRLI